MSQKRRGQNPFEIGNAPIRTALRVIGPFVLITGLLFTVIGLGSFFSSFGTFEPPRYFWCAIIGLPMTVFGLMLTNVGFLGAIVRYHSGEVAPVAKETFNYLAHGTREGVKAMTSAATSGIVEGLSQDEARLVACVRCGNQNRADASFCDECGNELVATQNCENCGEPNDHDAKFCNHCGSRLQHTS